jgi:ATP-grasp domain
MRRIAIMSKRRLAELTYAEWLGGSDRELLLFANERDEVARQAAHSPTSGYSTIRLVQNWNDDGELTDALVAEHGVAPLDALVALSETDLIRAARFREALGLPGQTLQSAMAFRDKRVMKDLARAAGLCVPAFATVTSVQQLADFARQIGGPVVMKPVDGGGCVDVAVIDDIEASETVLHSLAEPSVVEWMAEEYIDASILCVDGVMANGLVVASSVSTYPLDCYSCLRRCAPIALLQLDDQDARATSARAYVDSLVRALPSASLTTAFHCELFDCASRGMMLCEIASRTGGGRISDMFRQTHGIDLPRWSALGQAGLDPAGAVFPPTQSGLMGFLLVPSPGGILLDTPTPPPPRTFVDYRLYAQRGGYMPRCARVSEYAVDVLLSAATRGELEAAYRDALGWIESGFVWASETA